ncbi:GGDEF domain-containing protein [Chlorobium sp. BLA1]|uniref:GGDEF domain-containing protein n=1 Tax=Candidatus Chlorobium masyuteum TaxID=2716876 RepID=UPI00141F3302|nr:GGDEF domain-containing protein [Candidatus Chlorobium masyuteum]NHQ61128.1 GGDEF domain-containing protein [Candidatus Chlorobium masyuteum]NTU45322.1 GGDEF domain-containing protein [Chlorobiaceae bacterium]
MTEVSAVKKFATLKAIVVTGIISILLVLAGTAGLLVMQSNLHENVEKKQACYLDLIAFRGKLIEFELNRHHPAANLSNIEELPGKPEEPAGVLLFMYDKLAVEMKDAGLNTLPVLHAARQNSPALLALENLELFRFELDNTIQKVDLETRGAADKLVDINHFFLFFILAILLTLSITAGWLLHNNYRQTLIPLAQLASQLKLINRNIPESIHDTAEEMKKELTETEPSSDITQITESIMSFCGDIEAKNKKLDELHIRDEKTNLYNYRHFKDRLITEVERAKSLESKVSLAMIDIDHFKRYNDAHGHIAGDHVLEILAELISSQCRATDVPSRFGGEEFAVLFPKTDSDTAREIAERLRKLISIEPFPHEQHQPEGQLTVSIGIATFPGDAADWYTLINNADRALYKAKSAGRNNVVTFASMNADSTTEG